MAIRKNENRGFEINHIHIESYLAFESCIYFHNYRSSKKSLYFAFTWHGSYIVRNLFSVQIFQTGNVVENRSKINTHRRAKEEVAISEFSNLKYYYPIVEYEYITNGLAYSGNIVLVEKENIWVPEVNNWGDLTPI